MSEFRACPFCKSRAATIKDLETKNKLLNNLIDEIESVVDSIPLVNPYSTTTDGIFDVSMGVNRLRDSLARGVAIKDDIKTIYPPENRMGPNKWD